MRELKIALCATFLLPALAGCGDDGGGCDIPVGAWEIVYTEVSGDCNIGSYEVLVTYDGTAESLESTPQGCTGGRRLSDDQCTLVVDLNCEVRDLAGDIVGYTSFVGELNFVADDRVTGTSQQDGQGVDGSSCSSRFDIEGGPQ